MSPEEALFEWYCDTLRQLSQDFLDTADDEDPIWDDFYEADIGVASCFYVDNLRTMEAAGLVDAVAVDEGVRIRGEWFELMRSEETRSCSAVRMLPEWKALLARCAALRSRISPVERQ